MYRKLNGQYIVATLATLGNRIRERFPESNLNRICAELREIAAESGARIERLRRPHWPLRIGVALVVLAFAVVAVTAALWVRGLWAVEGLTIADVLQGLDAGVNEMILFALAIYFLASIEGRLKRREALRALHELRCIAHVIDMHQLTKDPEALASPALATPSSPRRTMTPFQLSRYLDYCSEMLSLTSKLAALHAQHLKDPVVLNAVNDVEALAGGLSQHIWQKIMLLDTDAGQGGPVSPSQSPPPVATAPA